MMIILFIGKTTITGYINYYKVVHDIGIEKTIDQVRTKSDYTELEHISKNFLNATVSIEDKRFYRHSGIDYISICRAIVLNIRERELVSGGSTISQQVSKNLFLTFDKTLERKATEYFITRRIESLYSKDEILELYVNIINYGDNNIGINQASLNYYKKTPNMLSLSEAVLLAGLPQSPANYGLSSNYTEAIIRSEHVINAMINNNHMDENTAKEILRILKSEDAWKQY